jgi:hypothetical protein
VATVAAAVLTGLFLSNLSRCSTGNGDIKVSDLKNHSNSCDFLSDPCISEIFLQQCQKENNCSATPAQLSNSLSKKAESAGNLFLLFQEARACQKSGNYSQAHSLCEKIIEKYKKMPGPLDERVDSINKDCACYAFWSIEDFSTEGKIIIPKERLEQFRQQTRCETHPLYNDWVKSREPITIPLSLYFIRIHMFFVYMFFAKQVFPDRTFSYY